MPIIPPVPNLDPVEKPMASPREYAKGGQAIEGMGETMQDISSEGLQLEANIREAQKHVDTIAAQNQLKAADDELQIALKKTTSSGQVQDVLQQYTGPNGKLNEIVKSMGKSPAAVQIGMMADSVRPSMNTLGQARQLTLLGQENEANTVLQVQTLLPELVTAKRSGNTDAADQIRAHVDGLYEEAVRTGLMTDAQKSLNMDAFDVQTRKQINEAAITSADPAERLQAIRQLGGRSTSRPSGSTDFTVGSKPKGMVEEGNLPVWNRPSVKNADGTHSSEYSTSFDQDGKEVLVPTVVDGKFLTPDGKKPPEGSTAEKAMFRAAWDHYLATGENLGKFDNPDAADAYADKLHNRGAVESGGKSSGPLDLTNMAAGDLSAMRVHAQEENQRLNTLAEAGNLNGALNVTQNAFQAPEFKHNYEARVEALQDPQWLKQHGIVAEDGSPDRVMAEKLIAETTRERAEWEKQQQDTDEKQVEKFSPLIDENKMTRADIDHLPDEAHGGISNRARAKLVSQWTQNSNVNRQLATTARQEATREKDEQSAEKALEVYMNISQGHIYDSVDIRTMPGLTARDKAQLLGTIKDAASKPGYTEAVKMITDALPLASLPKNPTPEQRDAYSDADKRAMKVQSDTFAAFQQRHNAHPEETPAESANEVLKAPVQQQITDRVNQLFGGPAPQVSKPAIPWDLPVTNFLRRLTGEDKAAPTAAPKDGDTKKNSAGDPVIFKGGEWKPAP